MTMEVEEGLGLGAPQYAKEVRTSQHLYSEFARQPRRQAFFGRTAESL